MSARRRRGEATRAVSSPVGRSCFCLPRAARRDRGRRRTTISCLHEKRCVAAGASTTRTGGRTSSGCGFRWGRLPIGEIDHIWACACRPAGIVWLPDGVGQWQGVGWLSCVLASLFRSLDTSTCTFFFRSLSVSLELVRNTLLACVRSGMRVGSVFESLVGLNTRISKIQLTSTSLSESAACECLKADCGSARSSTKPRETAGQQKSVLRTAG